MLSKLKLQKTGRRPDLTRAGLSPPGQPQTRTSPLLWRTSIARSRLSSLTSLLSVSRHPTILASCVWLRSIRTPSRVSTPIFPESHRRPIGPCPGRECSEPPPSGPGVIAPSRNCLQEASGKSGIIQQKLELPLRELKEVDCLVALALNVVGVPLSSEPSPKNSPDPGWISAFLCRRGKASQQDFLLA